MNGSTQGKNLTNPLVFGLIALIAIILIGFFALVALGRDIEQVVFAVSPTLVSLIGIVAVLFKADGVLKVNEGQTNAIDDLHAKTDTISKRVNGELDRKFNTLNDRIDGLSNQVKLSSINVPATEIDESTSESDAGASANAPASPAS